MNQCQRNLSSANQGIDLNEEIMEFYFEGNQVWFIGTPEQPVSMAVDICQALEIIDVHLALRKLDSEEKPSGKFYRSGQRRDIWLVTEAYPN